MLLRCAVRVAPAVVNELERRGHVEGVEAVRYNSLHLIERKACDGGALLCEPAGSAAARRHGALNSNLHKALPHRGERRVEPRVDRRHQLRARRRAGAHLKEHRTVERRRLGNANIL